MPRPRRSTATALRPAIKALRWDLARFELQCVETRELIAQLCKRAGIADEIEPLEQAEEKKHMSDGGRGKKGAKVSQPSRATDKIAKVVGNDGKSRVAKIGGSAKNPPKEKTPDEQGVDKRLADRASAEELAKVVAVISEAASRVAAAKRDKDAEGLRRAVASWERGERRAGELLVAMNGRVRPLPGAEVDKRRWRAAAQLSAADFAKKVQRSQRRALAAIGVRPGPAKRTPQPEMKMTPWTQEADGSLSRTLTAVDGGGAGAA